MRNTAFAVLFTLILAGDLHAQPAGGLEVIFCEIPTDPRSTMPGTKDLAGNPVATKIKSIEDFRVSHDGSAWIVKARSQLGSDLENALLIGSGVTGGMFAQEGRPFQGGVAGELHEFFDGNANPASFDIAGNIGFSARARGGSSANDEKVVYYNATTQTHTIVHQEGDPALGLFDNPPNPTGDEIFGSSIGSVFLRNDLSMGFVNLPIGNCHSSRYPAFFVGNTSFRQSGVSTIGGFIWDSFDYDDCGGTPDGLHWFAKGDIEGVPTSSNRILAVDDSLVLREGSPVAGSSMTMTDIFHTNMVSNGDWFSRGDDPNNDDWAVYNGTLVAKTGDEIGSTREFLGNIFLAFTGNRVGDWLLVANTTNADISRDTVILLNGAVVLREGDPVDLDENGLFDDDVFIGRGNNTSSAFAANDVFLADDLMLYFTAPLRDSSGNDLGSIPAFGSGGDAFMRISLAPSDCPTVLGDVSGDSIINGLDAQAFVDCALTPGPPIGQCHCADFNSDDVIDQTDLDAFVLELLTQ